MDWNEGLKKAKEKIKSSGNPSGNTASAVPVSGVYEHITNIANRAKAPYNFVPLNDVTVPSECIPGKDFSFNKYYEGRFTGYIELNIKTETPLYIRDTLTIDEMKEKDKIEKADKNKKYINPNFFSPANRNRIPGSSFRGLIRMMVEIMSYSKMQFIDHKKKYHFRSFADKSLDLRHDYSDCMMAGNDTNGYYQQVKAGYLTKIGMTYKIKPAKEVTVGGKLQYARVEESLVLSNRVLTNGMSANNYKMGFKAVDFLSDPTNTHRHSKKLYYAKVTGISDKDAGTLTNPLKGALVFSGKMPGRPRGKHMHWVIAEADSSAEPLKFADAVIENYRNDASRNVHEGAELLKQCKPGSDVPCFYIEENNKVISFGHTGLFRLAYKKSIEEFLPQSHCNPDSLDIVEAIFGNEKNFAGRVFFEDAFLDENQKQFLLDESVPKILSTPKPTTFQHYLVQHQTVTHQNNPEEGYLGLQNYDDDTWLRGNKLYWHKTGNKWEEEKLTFKQNAFNLILKDNNLNINQFNGGITQGNNKITVSLVGLPANLRQAIVRSVGKYEKTQHTRITPIDKNKTFTGRIRFENLSDVELGALLFALALPNGCCHKLGMGKPLGLGSVKITPKLFLSDRKARYESLFSEWETPIQESTSTGKDISHFKTKFEEYIVKGIDKTGTKLWDVDRMKELKRMLDFNNKPADDKTRYMEIKNVRNENEFKHRKVLPKSTEV
jgi:CRISPR-associated protein (TIGR03986 family)